VIRAGHSFPTRRSTSVSAVAFAWIALAIALHTSPSRAADADSVTTAPPQPAPATTTAPPPVAAPAPVVAPAATLPAPVSSEGDPWAKGTTWASFRFGYAKSAAEFAPNGNVGFGFAYSKFLSNKWALTGSMHYDVLGKFNQATEIEIPFGLDMTRHYKWPTPVRPYLGLGTGLFFHKTTGTDANIGDIRKGVYLTGGINSPISNQSLIGVDVRALFEFDAQTDNPVFTNEKSSVLHWSVKLNYARFF